MSGATPWIAAVLLVLDLFKHTVLIGLGQAQPWGDSSVYWQMGQAVAAGDWWLAGEPVAYRTPGYPWFLGACCSTFGDGGLFAAVIGQHLCVLLTSVTTVAIVWRMTRSAGWALVASSFVVLSTARPLYANWLLTESLATFLLTLSVFLTVLALGCGCWKRLALAGFVLGSGVLVRPSLLAGLPALLFAGLWLARQTEMPTRRRVLLIASGPLILALTLLPWCLRNQFLFDRFTLCAFTGRELWTAHFSPWPGGELNCPTDGAAAELSVRIEDHDLNWRHQWSVSYALAESGLNDVEVDELMERVAWQAIAAQPDRALFRTAARCATFWYCWEWETDLSNAAVPEQASRLYVSQFRWLLPSLQPVVLQALRWTPERWFVASNLWSLASVLGALLLLYRSSTRPVGILLMLVFATTTVLTASLEIPLYRYRCVLEPLMIAAVVAGLAAIVSIRRTA